MKRLLLCMLAMMMLVMTGCGGDDDVVVVVPVADPPTITFLQFSKNPATELVLGSVDFIAPDSDIDTMTVVVFDSRGFEVARSLTLINLPNVVTGTIPFTIDYFNLLSDTYTFSIFLTDFNGNISNQVVDVFVVP